MQNSDGLEHQHAVLEAASIERELDEAEKRLKTMLSDPSPVSGSATSRTYKTIWRRPSMDVPWYMIMGAPAVGKSHLIAHADLGRLAPEIDLDLSGVGGTRDINCVVSEQLTIIDTAGRYFSQDSNAIGDARAWESLLASLRRRRPRAPLAGVVLAVSAADILSAGDRIETNTLRRRLADLDKHLGVRLPIYLVVTHCDKIGGFVETFRDLGREEHTNIFGITFGIGTPPASEIANKLDSLRMRLEFGLVERLRQTNTSSAEAVFAFPAEFGFLCERLTNYLFSGMKSSRHVLRSIYFTSSVQWLNEQVFRLERAATLEKYNIVVPPILRRQQSPTPGRAYFVQRVFENIVAEAGMALRRA